MRVVSAAISAAGGRPTADREALLDLGAAGREGAEDIEGHALDVGDALERLRPTDAETGGQLRSQMGFVQVAGRLRMPVQMAGIDGRPSAVDAANGVGDEHVRVEVRVACATRPVAEGGCHEPVASNLLDATMTAPGPRRVPLQVAERGIDGEVVGLGNHGSDVSLGEPEHDGHGLRRTEGQVEAGDAPTLRRSEPCVGCWVTAIEQGRQGVCVDLSRQPEQGGAGTEPSAGSLALEVVVLHAASDRVEVVALLAFGQLADAQHGRNAVTTGAATATRACGASS